MNHPCRDFRLVLEGRLDGRAAPERLGDLLWNSHLFTCAECRALLDAEEALESLLASVPTPQLAPAVRARVLARLRSAREDDRLDRLLDVAADARAPAGLAANVLAALAEQRGAPAALGEVELDRLLDLDVVATPLGLGQRTLRALKTERAIPHPTRPRFTLVRALAFTAAAAALVALVWIVRPDRTPIPAGPVEVVGEPKRTPNVVREDATRVVREDATQVSQKSTPVSDEVLSVLDVLENWDILVANDGDSLLSSLPTADEALLYAFEEQG